ncbi:hypothetical protein C0033_00785 [Clostridium sp. chh4-2]|uniref:AGE family epimerase/isomerase n=1 Tax=Clostridium sp. chh4-2 TaxID=2067550 RepID=UPI000CCEBD8E|nr:AGE family epimerase/isomerase [Clostridium sp. chh4-2]PNV63900.1 hypothetical protein C0033_00785 [Clostridium sp. chh4-2]
MDRNETRSLLGFFRNQLTDELLSFWMPRCLDRENGGYFNCFTNDGSRLISRDKYVWSQGRFVWVFSRLSQMEGGTFTKAQRKTFLEYARNGRDFLMKNVLIGEDDWRCAFLLEADGTPKYSKGCDALDAGIAADCFVASGLARYSLAANDPESWMFAKKLYDSILDRYEKGSYHSMPYPLSTDYQDHGKPMGLTNVSTELLEAAKVFDVDYCGKILSCIDHCASSVFEEFTDENNLVHEFKYAQGGFSQNLFGQHINPGHTLEDMWFQLEAMDQRGDSRYFDKLAAITKKTLETGWDKEFGGLYHFITCDGKPGMEGDVGDAKNEPQMHLVRDDWGSKLWWVHSEALYTTLLLYDRTGDPELLQWFYRIFDYTYDVFPNPDREIREWIQIRMRDGRPQEKVVALPVKDPYHILRNTLLCVELLEKRLRKQSRK